MSQVSIIDIEGNHPQIPTQFNGNLGSAIPIGNQLNIFGTVVSAGAIPVRTVAAGNTVAVQVQRTQATAATDTTSAGLASFDSGDFTVDANGFVSLVSAPTTPLSILTNVGGPVAQNGAGQISVLGTITAASGNPLRSNGTVANTVSLVTQASSAQAASNINNAGMSSFYNVDFAVDAAGFVTLSSTGAGKTITGDTGGALSPTAGNWNIVGGAPLSAGSNAFVTSGSGSTLTGTAINCAKWIVDPTSNRGTHTTIAGAIAAASSGQTIFIRPGTYTEDLTLKAGVNLCSFEGEGLLGIIGSAAAAFTANVVILGTTTASFNGKVNCSGILFQTNGAAAINITGASALLNLVNCSVYAQNATGITGSTGGLSLFYCSCRAGTSTALFAFTGGQLDFEHCSIIMGSSATASTGAATNIGLRNCYTVNLNISVSTSGLALIYNSNFSYSGQTILTTAGTGSSTIYNSNIESGSASALSIGSGTTLTIANSNVSSSNTNAITGAGTINSGGITYTNTSSLNNVTTQVPEAKSNDALVIKIPGAYPYTTVPQDAVILVDTSAARTIVPLASATLGQRHTIKDNVGSAATNAITITPSGALIDGLASRTINSNWGSVDIVFAGTDWRII